eukprot:TRINITY_DN8089_c0_g1_i1.p1 TRINITY_DN8089_c0_g1~~TRINITY_DN8089_c0_g1_i1.p1  ORF type:complete len:225 (-),score=81.74 TRINITY_DN8089_c0_g1_i1:172-846(-)
MGKDSTISSAKSYRLAFNPINIRLLGDDLAGKSTFLRTLSGIETPFDGQKRPDVSKEFSSEGNPRVTINLWDTPRTVRWDDSEETVYASELDAIIVMFDLTNRLSYANVTTKWHAWIQRQKEDEDEDDRLKSNTVLILIGSKSDLAQADPVVTAKEIRETMSQFDGYFELNSNELTNIIPILKDTVNKVMERRIIESSRGKKAIESSENSLFGCGQQLSACSIL